MKGPTKSILNDSTFTSLKAINFLGVVFDSKLYLNDIKPQTTDINTKDNSNKYN